MVKVIIGIGLPGTGKSTYFKNDIFKDYVICSTDNLIEEYGKKVGKTYNDVFASQIKRAELKFFEQIKENVLNNQDIIIDRTNLTVRGRKRIIDFVKSFKPRAEFYAHEFAVNEKDWPKFLNRPGKTIPKNILENMSKYATSPSFDEEFKRIYYHETVWNEK